MGRPTGTFPVDQQFGRGTGGYRKAPFEVVQLARRWYEVDKLTPLKIRERLLSEHGLEVSETALDSWLKYVNRVFR